MKRLWIKTLNNTLISVAMFAVLFGLLWLAEWLMPSVSLLHWDDAAWCIGIPASIIGVAYVLSVRDPQNYTGFYPGMLMSALLGLQFFLQGNYDLTLLSLVVFIPFQLKSVLQWRRPAADDAPFRPGFFSMREMLLSLLVFLVLVLGDYLLVTYVINHDSLTESVLLKLTGGLMIASSVLANFWLIYRKNDAWIYWIIYSISGIVFYVIIGNAFSIVLFSVFLVINSLAGWNWVTATPPEHYGWLRTGKSPSSAKETFPPHGTGEYIVTDNSNVTPQHMPDIRLRLWLTATNTDLAGIEERLLDDEERALLPGIIHESNVSSADRHPLDTPWEITVNNDSFTLAPELAIRAWINEYDDIFDGKTLIIHHDMPLHLNPCETYPVSLLTEGDTAIAEHLFIQSGAVYDVRLNIQWLKQESQCYTLPECFRTISRQEQWAEYKDGENELEVMLSYDGAICETYKAYKPSEFPERFIEDLQNDAHKYKNLVQVVIQPYEFYEEHHSRSDDYCDAAEAYGEDYSDWYTTERRKTGKRMSYEIKENRI